MKKVFLAVTMTILMIFASFVAIGSKMLTNESLITIENENMLQTFGAAAEGGLFLYPIGDGTYNEWTSPTGSPHYENVADPAGNPDDEATIICSSEGVSIDSFILEDPDPYYEGNKIYSIEIFVRTKNPATNSAEYYVYPMILTHGSLYKGQGNRTTKVWTNYCGAHWSKNPETDMDWTWDEVKELEIGIKCENQPGTICIQQCTQVYAVVNLEPSPYLKKYGSIDSSWWGVRPGKKFTSTFKIYNGGDPGSELNWEIVGYPSWGSDWTITPYSGTALTPEDGNTTIKVSLIAPKIDEFFGYEWYGGKISLRNTDNPANYQKVSVGFWVNRVITSILLILKHMHP